MDKKQYLISVFERLAKECVEKEYSVRALEERLKLLSSQKKPASSAKKDKPALSAEGLTASATERPCSGTRARFAPEDRRRDVDCFEEQGLTKPFSACPFNGSVRVSPEGRRRDVGCFEEQGLAKPLSACPLLCPSSPPPCQLLRTLARLW